MYTAMDSGVANDDVVVVMGQAVPRRRAEQGCSCCSLMAFGAFLATIFLWPRDPIIKANQVELVAHLADPDQTNVFSFGLNEVRSLPLREKHFARIGLAVPARRGGHCSS